MGIGRKTKQEMDWEKNREPKRSGGKTFSGKA